MISTPINQYQNVEGSNFLLLISGKFMTNDNTAVSQFDQKVEGCVRCWNSHRGNALQDDYSYVKNSYHFNSPYKV